MGFPVLPAKYYLDHFFELIHFLNENYQDVLEKKHTDFIQDFRSLSEDAQCAYVRMVNRKGSIFQRNHFLKYKEIENPISALNELNVSHFVSDIDLRDRQAIVEFLTKPDLCKWLQKSGVEVKSSASRESILENATQSLSQLDLQVLPQGLELLAQRRTTEIDYLLFLYFGKLQKSLNLYTLRDLGIRKTNVTKTDFKPRYRNLHIAMTDYRLSVCLQKIDCIDEDKSIELIEECQSFIGLPTSTRALKNQLLLGLANKFEDTNTAITLMALQGCDAHPAREKLARILYRTERVQESKAILEQIIETPYCDEELLFAEDFLERKFESKRVGYLTETLRTASEITLSDAYFKKPEEGVRRYFLEKGQQAYFTENHLWTGLFGLMFWDELFEGEDAGLYNPFERSPADLVNSEFYKKNQLSIESKLSSLVDIRSCQIHILKMVSEHYGKMNDVFHWTPNLALTILTFLKASQEANIALILRSMAMQFEHYHSGYPDLMILDQDRIQFIEVKAEGDSLRSKQFSKIQLLREAGLSADILKVRWQVDPNQEYIVVDVETTGGSAQFHRVTEIGAVKVQGGQIIDQFQTLINPGRSIPSYITQITGITDEMVAQAPSFSDIADKFDEFTKGGIFVAHNAKFDYGFIQKEFQRLDKPYVRSLMCTVAGMKRQYPGLPSYSLKNLTSHFEISLNQHHRALCDAQAAAQLLFLINVRRKPKESIELSDC